MSLREGFSAAVPLGLAEPEGRQGRPGSDGSAWLVGPGALLVRLLPGCRLVPQLPAGTQAASHLPSQPCDSPFVIISWRPKGSTADVFGPTPWTP